MNPYLDEDLAALGDSLMVNGNTTSEAGKIESGAK